jgi:hypothetical protein
VDDDDDIRDAPPVVIGSVAAGSAPLPFLAVYALLFIARGTVRPVIPPDVGNSKGDELLAGIVAFVLLVVAILAVYWFLDGRRRWLFLIAQAAVLATSVDFALDASTGARLVPVVLAVTSLIALVLALAPGSWEHVRSAVPPWLRGRGAGRSVDPAESALPAGTPDIQP